MNKRRTPISVVKRPNLKRTLRNWQISALESWENEGHRGIVAAATGTGKSMVALEAISRLWTPTSRTLVVVPSINLQEQWVRLLSSEFQLRLNQIGRIGGPTEFTFQSSHSIIVAVINSAREVVHHISEGWREEKRPTFLIVDECHGAATLSNQGVFHGDFTWTMGLSATPERSDNGMEEILIPSLGPVVHRYSLKEALDDGILAPLKCINIYFELDEEDTHALNAIEDLITQTIIDVIKEGLASKELSRYAIFEYLERQVPTASLTKRLIELYRRRREILESSPRRREVLEACLRSNMLVSTRSIIFHEKIRDAIITLQLARATKLLAVMDNSQLSASERRVDMDMFRSGSSNVLVAVRTIDEGIDVPDAKLAIIVHGTSSSRQRIQRIGRVVRPTGETAMVVSILARNSSEEFHIGARDFLLVGRDRITHHIWNDQPIDELLELSCSTYTPTNLEVAD